MGHGRSLRDVLWRGGSPVRAITVELNNGGGRRLGKIWIPASSSEKREEDDVINVVHRVEHLIDQQKWTEAHQEEENRTRRCGWSPRSSPWATSQCSTVGGWERLGFALDVHWFHGASIVPLGLACGGVERQRVVLQQGRQWWSGGVCFDVKKPGER